MKEKNVSGAKAGRKPVQDSLRLARDGVETAPSPGNQSQSPSHEAIPLRKRHDRPIRGEERTPHIPDGGKFVDGPRFAACRGQHREPESGLVFGPEDHHRAVR